MIPQLDQMTGLTPNERARFKDIAANLIEIMELARKPDVTMDELRAAVRYRIV